MSLCARVMLVGSGADGTGPTLLLTTHKMPRYGSQGVGSSAGGPENDGALYPPASEVLFFNVCECACRVANAAHVRLAASRAVAVTRAAPARIAGLPSLVFHLSDGGAADLAIIGGDGLEEYVSAMGAFVARKYPAVTIVPLTDVKTPSIDSRGVPAYAGWGGGSTGKIGTRVWAIAIDDTVHGQKEEASLPAESTGFSDEMPHAKRARHEIKDALSCACYVIAISGPSIPAVAGSLTDIEITWLVVADVPRAALTEHAAQRVSEALVSLGAPSGSVNAVFHLTDAHIADDLAYASSWRRLGSNHIMCTTSGGSWGDATTISNPATPPLLRTFFPAASRLTIANHKHNPDSYPLLLPRPSVSYGQRNPTVLAAQPLDSWIVFPSFRTVARGSVDIDTASWEPCDETEIDVPSSSSSASAAAARTVSVDGKNLSAASALRDSLRVCSKPTPSLVPPRLFVLGTGAAAPGTLRSCSAALIDLRRDNGAFLIDCGEGALGKLSMLPWRRVHESGGGKEGAEPIFLPRMKQLRGVFISHLHADHHTGLLTLLSAYAALRANAFTSADAHSIMSPLCIIGPQSLLPILRTYAALDARDARVTCSARAPDPQYLFFDAASPVSGTSITQAMYAGSHGGTDSSAWHIATIDPVRVDHCRDSFGVSVSMCQSSGGPARVLVYSGDTRPCSALTAAGVKAALSAGAGARVTLLHEATFTPDKSGDAVRKRHSTTEEARGVAKALSSALKATASSSSSPPKLATLILTHFSQRYTPGLEADSIAATGAIDDSSSMDHRDISALDLLCVEL
jgi:ribonuclease BN (tRNA processing enzyme)